MREGRIASLGFCMGTFKITGGCTKSLCTLAHSAFKGLNSRMRTIGHWNDLPGEAVDSPTSDAFQIELDRVVAQLV